ncbi:MAG TPA: DUF4384 domain-containing protein [Pirellulales bacterium]|nr:DUF4384 domain-containing protein [Pirellulales bacterium]
MLLTRVILLVTLALVPASAATTLAQPPEEPQGATGPEAIRQQQPSFLVRADVNHETRTYQEGEGLKVRVICEVDAFVYVLYKQADGKLFQIFPNSDQPDNRVRARQAVQIPADDDLFRWRIEPPFGKEMVKVIASTEPIDPLHPPEMRKAFFNPLSGEQLKGVEFALGDRDPAGWAEDQIEIVTQPRQPPPAPEGPKRWGVFFGVANYEFNSVVEEISEGKRHLNLKACDHDAQQMAEVLRTVGGLSEARTFIDAAATRKNLEDAVTRWLPSVSRPGDTVVIFFSGHGGQVSDDNGDEADRQDEFLLPYDYLNLEILAGLAVRERRGQLDPRLAPRLAYYRRLVQRAGSAERASALLQRTSSVTDDLFAHWLQRLSGRHVVAILDICHAGGFATREKGVEDDDEAPDFDFLEQEVTRLKDIGQRDTALMAACGVRELSYVRLQGDFGVMTKNLLDGITAAPGSLTLKEGFERCRTGMHAYFVEVNQALRAAGKRPLTEHRPYLVDYCSKPPLLKP